VRSIPVKYTKLLIAVGFVLMASLVTLVLLLHVDGPTARAQAAEMLMMSGDARERISEQLKKNPEANISFDAKSLLPSHIGSRTDSGERIEISYREISPKGEIKIFSPQLGVLFVLTPTYSGGEVKWSCWGSPNKKVPVACRENS
jgi:hypothetical protein